MAGEQDVAAALAEEEAGMDQGFKADEAAPVTPAPAVVDPPDTTVAQPVVEAAPVMIGGIPEKEWNEAVARAVGPQIQSVTAEIRKAFGQQGEFKKTLDALSQRLAAGGGSTPAARKLTADMLKRVNEELPGLGDALAADLAPFFDVTAPEAAQPGSAPTFNPDEFFSQRITPALQQLLADADARAEMRIVKTMHRDFDAVVKSPDFSTWLSTLPPDRAQIIRDSEDGFVAADAVTDFKKARDDAVKRQRTNKERVENAVAPGQGRGPTAPVQLDEDAAMEIGFKSVR